MPAGPPPNAAPESLHFDLELFEHLVETPHSHILRVIGRWSGGDLPGPLPHPSLVAGDEGDPAVIAPLPIPGQDAPRPDGRTAWRGTFAVPRDRFDGANAPSCALQAVPGLRFELPPLALPDEPSTVDGRPPAAFRSAMPAAGRPETPPIRPAAADESGGAPPARFGELILPALRARRGLVLAVVAVALAGALAGVAVRSPRYRAAATLLVTPLPSQDVTLAEVPDVRSGRDPEVTLQTAAQLVRSPAVAAATARRLGRPWSERTVREEVTVEPVSGKSTLRVTAVQDRGAAAARLVNTFAQTAVDLRNRRLRTLAADALASARAQLAAVADQSGAQAQALQLRISALRQVLDVRDATLSVARSAAVPRSPAGLPPAGVVLLTALAGLALAAGAALLLEQLGVRRVSTVEDAVAIYPLPVMGRVRRRALRLRGRAATQEAETFRGLLVQLGLEGEGHRSVMLTSPAHGDGKTTSAIGLARTGARAGRDVVLVDLDLRKPALAARLGVRPDRGLDEAAGGRASVTDALAAVPSEPHLRLLAPSSALPPAEAATTTRAVGDLLGDLADAADVVVVDSPPIGEIADALAVAGAVDDVVLVCRLGRTRAPQLQAVRDLLERTGVRPAGFLFVG